MPAKLDEIRIANPLLTNIVRGYSNNEFIGKELFPIVSVDAESGKIPIWGKEAFVLWNTNRALRADSNEVEDGWFTQDSYSTDEHDASIRVDYREFKQASNLLKYKKLKANRVQEIIELGLEVEYAQMAFDLDTYPADNKVTLTDDYYNESEIDFVIKLHDKIKALRKIIGRKANTIVMGSLVWDNIRFNAKFKSYLTKSSDQSVIPTTKDLANLLGVDKILVGQSLYTEDKNSFIDIWGNYMLLAYVVPPPAGLDRDKNEPCFGYTLRAKGYPYSDEYKRQGGKLHYVRSTDNYTIKVVGAESGYLIKNPINPTTYAA